MERTVWTDERLTESFDLLRADIADVRADIRALRQEVRAILLVLVTGLLAILAANSLGA